MREWKNQQMKRVSILDCTLRDGGFALEDAVKNGIRTEKFSDEDRENIATYVSAAQTDIIEIGAIEVTKSEKRGFAIYQNIEEISTVKEKLKSQGKLYAGFYRGPDISLDNVPEWNESMIDITRVCLRYSELEKSLEFAKGLSQKGYKVFLQPMVTVRYTEHELDMVLNAANEMNAYAVYFVDSYGYMTPEDVNKYFTLFDKKLKSEISIGFHAHNNMEMALINVLTLISIDTSRKIIIDACASGMGQGTGNLQSEVIMNYMNRVYGCRYNVSQMFRACELVDRFNVDHLWGYSVPRYIAAQNHTAYKYAMALKDKYKMTYSDIDYLLKNIPEDLRFRYTPENTEELLKRLTIGNGNI